MPRRVWTLLLALSFASFGCEESKPTGTAPTATASAKATAAATTTAAASATSSSTASAKAGNMTHCPSSVDGATTEIKDTKEGVDLVVKAKDDAAVKDVRARAAHLVEASKNESGKAKHTGEGEGGGQFGRCPVVMKETTVEAKDVEGGSSISVKAKDAKEVDWLRRESKERLAELKEPGGKDAGQRKMAHCPSAVEGATTAVKQGKDAVELTITAKDEAATKEIRERSKFLVEAAKLDPTDVKHTGEGKGGGGLGRCPVVMKDTSIEAKDVPGGSLVTVKPKTAADLANVAKEAKERSEAFAPPGGTAAPAASPATPPPGTAKPKP